MSNSGLSSRRLLQVPLGEQVRIVRINDLMIAKRLFAMGLLPGTMIALIRRGLFTGSCYVKAGTLSLALRKQEAEAIEIE